MRHHSAVELTRPSAGWRLEAPGASTTPGRPQRDALLGPEVSTRTNAGLERLERLAASRFEELGPASTSRLGTLWAGLDADAARA